jgi:predicted Fe-Mo cluster-binding NifX family protein
MKIAVASQNRKTITEHAGKCRKFWIYEIDDKTVVKKTMVELAKEQSFHEHRGAGPHPLDGINVLISGGAGHGLIRRLNNMGIQGLVTAETEPDSAVAHFLNGTLKLGQSWSHVGHGEHQHGEHDCCH